MKPVRTSAALLVLLGLPCLWLQRAAEAPALEIELFAVSSLVRAKNATSLRTSRQANISLAANESGQLGIERISEKRSALQR